MDNQGGKVCPDDDPRKPQEPAFVARVGFDPRCMCVNVFNENQLNQIAGLLTSYPDTDQIGFR